MHLNAFTCIYMQSNGSKTNSAFSKLGSISSSFQQRGNLTFVTTHPLPHRLILQM